MQIYIANETDRQNVWFDDLKVDFTPQLIVQENHYYPFGMGLSGIEKVGKPNHKYLYNGKEKQEAFGLNWLSYGQREYDPAIGRFNRVDRFAEKYYGFSSYQYGANDPIKTIDINGDSTFVTITKDGTYRVVGGNLDGDDNGIYIRNEDGTVGDLVGYSATPQSFYFEEGDRWAGTIDPNDFSGKAFLNDLLYDTPNIFYYMPNATGGQKYDFKRLGLQQGVDAVEYMYRGMPIMGTHKRERIFASARDVGNMGAGLVAALKGLPWSVARAGYDGLQSLQDGTLTTESMSTKYAERLGYIIGAGIVNKQTSHLRLPGNEHLRGKKIFNRPLKKKDY
ncbi:RHS repeat-associated core domain-containing protein [uncultured Microscilla sp.]|uniref:RHS repeat-associated core domain-containing protein n=1 Tax=uncultured Microscilla sp. TaxID=432653 RepID=UPI002638D9E9|nr:RHS repeat-associated core domain-containing protein [uncultured Microscilla sp.]